MNQMILIIAIMNDEQSLFFCYVILSRDPQALTFSFTSPHHFFFFLFLFLSSFRKDGLILTLLLTA